MHPRGIHHLGVAVQDLDVAVDTYTRLFGGEVEHRATVEEQGVEAAAVLVGDGRSPIYAGGGPPSELARVLARALRVLNMA